MVEKFGSEIPRGVDILSPCSLDERPPNREYKLRPGDRPVGTALSRKDVMTATWLTIMECRPGQGCDLQNLFSECVSDAHVFLDIGLQR